MTIENVPSGSREDPNLTKPTKSAQKSLKGSSETPVGASKAPERELPPPVSQANFNKELMLILKDLNTKITNQNEKVESRNVRIDQLVHKVDSFCSHEDDEQLDYDDYEPEDDSCENGLIQDSEPLMKETKTDEESVFKSLSEKFQNSESVDCEIDEHLAEFINLSFQNGIIDDKQTELFKIFTTHQIALDWLRRGSTRGYGVC